MELKYLQTFKTIIEEGSFLKAAEKLNYTQSTITFQIGQLEKEFAVTLFERTGRRMTLTKAGEQFLPYVEDVLASVERMHAFENNLQGYEGTLRVGIGETLLCYKMPAVLKEFHRLAPNAQLYLQSMNCYEIRDAVINSTLDLGVFYGNVGGYEEKLTTYDLGTFDTALVASKSIQENFPDFITEGQQIPIPFIINEKNCIFRQIFEAYLREKGIQLDHTIELWSIPTIKNLVASDVGISYLPIFAAEEELAGGRLVTIDTDIKDGSITAIVAHHKNKWVSPLMELFIDLCRKMDGIDLNF